VDIKEAANPRAAAQRSGNASAPLGRRALAAALSGAALSLVPLLGSRANANGRSTPPSDSGATGDSTGGTTADTTGVTIEAVNATTTTAPPKQPTPEDIELLGFAQSVELTIVSLYARGLETGEFPGLQGEALNTIRQAHLAYAQSISGLLGRDAPNVRNESLYADLESDFSGDAASIVAAAASLEDVVVATHTELVGELVGLDGSTLIASILVVEARNALVLKYYLDVSVDDQLATAGTAISPSDHPVE
jgi:Ferritin-like domain